MPNESQQKVNQPELKIGPFPGGIAVAVWKNTINTEQGPRTNRSITISPRRYKDPESGEWKNASSFRYIDLSALILALQKAQEFCATTPLPGQADTIVSNESETPF